MNKFLIKSRTSSSYIMSNKVYNLINKNIQANVYLVYTNI